METNKQFEANVKVISVIEANSGQISERKLIIDLEDNYYDSFDKNQEITPYQTVTDLEDEGIVQRFWNIEKETYFLKINL